MENTTTPPVRMQADLVRDRWHRYKLGNSAPYPSVTTITGKLSMGDALLWWAGDCSYKAVMSQWEIIENTPEDQAAVQSAIRNIKDRKFVRGAFNQDREGKADIGSQFHLVADKYACGQSVRVDDLLEEARGRCLLFEQFLTKAKPTVLLAEFPCFNDTMWYAGTADQLWRWDCGDGKGVQTWLVDFKTGASAYCQRDNGWIFPIKDWMQLTALSRCEFYYDTHQQARVPMPKIDRMAIVAVHEGAVRLWEWPMADIAWHGFISLRVCYDLEKAKVEPRSHQHLEVTA